MELKKYARNFVKLEECCLGREVYTASDSHLVGAGWGVGGMHSRGTLKLGSRMRVALVLVWVGNRLIRCQSRVRGVVSQVSAVGGCWRDG